MGALAVALLVACGGEVGQSTFDDPDKLGSNGNGSSAPNLGNGSSDGGSGSDGGGTSTEPATDVEVVITADNAYAFGWGTETQVSQLKGRPVTTGAADIFSCPVNTTGSGASGFGPESYVVPAADAPTGAYLYVATWDDNSVTQGLLGQFKRKGSGSTLYTGNGAWEVCATGDFYDSRPEYLSSSGPAMATVNADIARCNAGTISTSSGSGGWVNPAGAVTAGAVGKLAVGEDNSAGGSFPITCQKDEQGNQGINESARWMWYTPDSRDAFTARNTRSYLIFRLPTTALPPVTVQ